MFKTNKMFTILYTIEFVDGMDHRLRNGKHNKIIIYTAFLFLSLVQNEWWYRQSVTRFSVICISCDSEDKLRSIVAVSNIILLNSYGVPQYCIRSIYSVSGNICTYIYCYVLINRLIITHAYMSVLFFSFQRNMYLHFSVSNFIIVRL